MRNEYLEKFLALGGPFGFGRIMGLTDTVEIDKAVKRETDAIRARWHFVYEYAWAVPTDPTLALLAEHSPIVEVGAGGGYWARLLLDMGADVIAYDIAPGPVASPTERATRQARRVWTGVLAGDATVAGEHPDRTLFLCWPPYDETMASDALTAYLNAGGTRLVYIGEGPGGCTGDDYFHDLLDQRMDERAILPVPQWPGLHDDLYLYTRKEQPS